MDDDTERLSGEGASQPGSPAPDFELKWDPNDDEARLLVGAFRLARFSALISPATLMEELSIDRASAERLLVRLEEQGIVGPIVFPRSGARESRVNMLQDPLPGGTPSATAATEAVRRHTGMPVVGTVGGAVLATAIGVVGILLHLGERLVAAIVPFANLSAVMVLGALLTMAVSAGIGLLLERLLTSNGGPLPAWLLTLRQALWLVFAFVTVAAAFFRMFLRSTL